MNRLLINSQEIDLSRDTKIQLNRLLFDLSDMDKRGITITNTITCPPTTNNKRILGNANRYTTNNKAFEGKYKYNLLDDVGVVSSGTVVIRSYDENKGIKIQLSEGFDFWGRASEKKLNDLVNHADDFKFTAANMDSLKTKSSSVFLTALHTATGNTTDTALVNYNYTRPCIAFKPLLDKVVSDLGYTIDYDVVLTNTLLSDIGCLSNSKEFVVSDYKVRFQSEQFNGAIDPSSGVSIIPSTMLNTTPISGNIAFNLYKTGLVFKGSVFSPRACRIEVQFPNRTERISIPQGQSFLNYRTDPSGVGDTVSINTTDQIEFEDLYLYSIIKEADIFEVEGSITLGNSSDSSYVLGDYNLPLMTYKEFIKVLFKMFFLDADVNEVNKTIKLTYLNGAVSQANNIDISDRVNINNSFTSGNLYARLNEMGYSNDEDIDSELGSLFFTVQNDNAPAYKKWISVDQFSASNQVTTGVNVFVTAPIYNTVENKRASVKDRIVYFANEGSFGFNAQFNPISFTQLHSNYYLDFISNTSVERVFDFEVQLKKILFNSLSRKRLVYIKEYESLFLITRVKGFDNEALTKIEAIKWG